MVNEDIRLFIAVLQSIYIEGWMSSGQGDKTRQVLSHFKVKLTDRRPLLPLPQKKERIFKAAAIIVPLRLSVFSYGKRAKYGPSSQIHGMQPPSIRCCCCDDGGLGLGEITQER